MRGPGLYLRGRARQQRGRVWSVHAQHAKLTAPDAPRAAAATAQQQHLGSIASALAAQRPARGCVPRHAGGRKGRRAGSAPTSAAARGSCGSWTSARAPPCCGWRPRCCSRPCGTAWAERSLRGAGACVCVCVGGVWGQVGRGALGCTAGGSAGRCCSRAGHEPRCGTSALPCPAPLQRCMRPAGCASRPHSALPPLLPLPPLTLVQRGVLDITQGRGVHDVAHDEALDGLVLGDHGARRLAAHALHLWEGGRQGGRAGQPTALRACAADAGTARGAGRHAGPWAAERLCSAWLLRLMLPPASWVLRARAGAWGLAPGWQLHCIALRCPAAGLAPGAVGAAAAGLRWAIAVAAPLPRRAAAPRRCCAQPPGPAAPAGPPLARAPPPARRWPLLRCWRAQTLPLPAIWGPIARAEAPAAPCRSCHRSGRPRAAATALLPRCKSESAPDGSGPASRAAAGAGRRAARGGSGPRCSPARRRAARDRRATPRRADAGSGTHMAATAGGLVPAPVPPLLGHGALSVWSGPGGARGGGGERPANPSAMGSRKARSGAAHGAHPAQSVQGHANEGRVPRTPAAK